MKESFAVERVGFASDYEVFQTQNPVCNILTAFIFILQSFREAWEFNLSISYPADQGPSGTEGDKNYRIYC